MYFDYKLIYKAEVTNKSNSLSWHLDHKEGVEFDNSGEILLEPKLFNQTKGTGRKPFTKINVTTTEDTLDPHQIFYVRATGRGGFTIIDEDLKN